MKKLLLFDADISRYSLGSIQARHPFLEGEFIPAPAKQICRLVDDLIKNSCKACYTDRYICVLSGSGNFRNEIAKQVEYKGNRNNSKGRPFHYDTVTNHIIENHPHIIIDGHEADDYMGYMQYDDWLPHFKENGFDIDPDKLVTIIGSRDKDLRTVQGWHYSWSCGSKQPEKPLYYISPSQAMYKLFYQMLIGDNTDNILGCGVRKLVPWGKEIGEDGEMKPKMMLRRKGVGEKTADAILQACEKVSDMKEAVINEYKEVFPDNTEEILLENARLLFIGQKADHMFEWEWLDKYLELPNENYVDPATVVVEPKKRKRRTKKLDSIDGEPDTKPVPTTEETPIPVFG